MTKVMRGDIWLFNPDPVRGREIGKKLRPGLIISTNIFNNGPSELVIIVPLTSKEKQIYSHVLILPENGGIKTKSFAMCEQIRSISKERLVTKWGTIENHGILREITGWIADLLQIEYFG